eukprot:TRINITY_DN5296_c0_g1_i1.p1 TRINITY_DN5296_c0_g1~~TRINITY_DN5296_c0_g1_i1.p1  ORF type:complete len:272 (+),score=33.51 TRINITY_DN5296_c0_g1_i1:35-817(+)
MRFCNSAFLQLRVASQLLRSAQGNAVVGSLQQYNENLNQKVKHQQQVYYQQILTYAKTPKKQFRQHEGVTSHHADHPGLRDTPLDVSDNEGLMQNALTHFEAELAKLSVGRATPAMLDHLKISAYGNTVPFNQVAICTVRGPQLLVARPYDPTLLKEIEKAIAVSPLKLNPKVEGEEVLVPIPRPTSESVEAMVKVVHAEGEKAKVSIRHERKKARDAIKGLNSENEKLVAEREITKIHDQFIKQIDDLVKKKVTSIRQG